MAPLFTASDVALLAAAFPPPTPQSDRPSLVRARNGTFVISTKVLKDLDTLLDTANTRVEVRHIASALGIDDADWVLRAYEAEVVFSRDRKHIIPRQEVAEILAKISHSAEKVFINLDRMTTAYDVARDSLQTVADREVLAEHWLSFQSPENRGEWITTPRHASHTQNDLKEKISAAETTNQLHLHELFPQIPYFILRSFATEAVGDDGSIGQLEYHDDSVIFTPAGFEDAQDAVEAANRQANIDSALRQFKDEGYCVITGQEVLSEVSRMLANEPHTQLGSLEDQAHEDIIILQDSHLETLLENACQNLPTKAKQMWNSRDTTNANDGLQAALMDSVLDDVTESKPLKTAILRYDPHKSLSNAVATEISRLQSEESDTFKNVIQHDLFASLQLLKAGIDNVKDETLRDHLEQFCGDHARRELMPKISQRLHKERLLLDKNRSRNMEKFEQAAREAKNLSEVHAASQRFMKKLKIEEPSEDVMTKSKSQSLEHTISSMRSFSRGSDILQNLLWVLLATHTTGLYLSSGKDTSRMIKFFGSVGDLETLKRLEGWRDALKAGQDSTEAQQEMRKLAIEAVKGHEK